MNDKSLAVKPEQAAVEFQQPSGSDIMAVISRAATDPNVDVEKMERLMAMYERIEGKKAETAFNAAMVEAQQEMRPISADANNPQTRSRYASYAKLDASLRPIYTRHGFSLSFDTGDAAQDYVRVVCQVAHAAGFSRSFHIDMPADGKGAKGGDVMTKTHAAGAAMSYGMRYLLKMIFNVAVGEDDTDGNPPSPKVSEEQEANLQALIEEVGANKPAFLKFLKVSALADIRADRYAEAVKMLEAKRRRS